MPRGLAVLPFGWIMVVLDGPVGGLRGEERKTLISAPESRYALLAVQARCDVGSGVVLSLK